MPTFYFDIDDGERQHRDDEGLVLENAESARTQAILALPDIARDVLPDGGQRTFIASVRNSRNEIIFRAKLALTSELVEPNRSDPRGV